LSSYAESMARQLRYTESNSNKDEGADNMDLAKKHEPFQSDDVWIISKGKHTKFDLSSIYHGVNTTLVKEYRISDLARYLLNPNPIEVRKVLVGCEVCYHQLFSDRVREKVRKILPRKMHGLLKESQSLSEVFMADRDKEGLLLKDEDLKSHIKKIQMALRGADPIVKRLGKLDISETENITGICEDAGSNRSLLNLKGSVVEKIGYMENYILKDVGVILEKAHVSDGLFEMSGFDFSSYNSKNSHRLIKFYDNGMPRYCVVGFDGKVEYWVDNINLINKMHLLEHSIKANPKFNKSLNMCTKGDAKPLRLLFKPQLEIDYSKSPLPAIYKNIFKTYDIGSTGKDAVMKSLRSSQLGILFNYLPKSIDGGKKLFTNVSVMHDVKALDSIKEDLPELYSIINKMSAVSEAGRYYLLDSLGGYSNE